MASMRRKGLFERVAILLIVVTGKRKDNRHGLFVHPKGISRNQWLAKYNYLPEPAIYEANQCSPSIEAVRFHSPFRTHALSSFICSENSFWRCASVRCSCLVSAAAV